LKNFFASGLKVGFALMACAALSNTFIACGLFGSDGRSFEDPAILLEQLPIDLAAIDYDSIAAKSAGRDSDWLPISDFGLYYPPTADRPTGKTNPQPTFYAPLGTPVVAIVTGVVTSVTKLYSNDTSVMIRAGNGSDAPIWEMEHVVKVRVQVGDAVVAGETIAEVSDYECKWGRNSNPADPLCASGLGLVEIGLLYGGNPPEHRCPFEDTLVAPARRTAIFNQLDAARARIRTATGDTTLFDKASWSTPQCVSLTRVPG
jgi:hypothetical protein